MRIKELTVGKISDVELKERARGELLSNPKGYWDFLASVRENITEAQMIMLIDYQDRFNLVKSCR